jgi:hypothetical protein
MSAFFKRLPINDAWQDVKDARTKRDAARFYHLDAQAKLDAAIDRFVTLAMEDKRRSLEIGSN